MTLQEKNFLHEIECYLQEHYPILTISSLFQLLDEAPNLRSSLSKAIHYYQKTSDHNHIEALDAYAKTSFSFLREQALFMNSGCYVHHNEHQLNTKLYSSKERMMGDYLPGLMLTYALWPNHLKLYNYYIHRFLSNLSPSSAVFEIGFGHGLMLATLLDHCRNSSFFGVDISQYSIDFTRNLLKKLRLSERRVELLQCNVFEQSLILNKQYNAGICCELLEHVENPDKLLGFYYDWLLPDAPLFVSTVINVAAEDHIYRFESRSDLYRLFESASWHIEDEAVFKLDQYSNENMLCANYAAVLSKKKEI